MNNKSDVIDFEELEREEKLLSWLKVYTSLVAIRLRTEDFSEEEAVCFLEEVKKKVLDRFPDKEYEYSIIYERRFKRILQRKGIFLALDRPGSEKMLT